jgi:predicted RNase H-like HicB family nuclease
MSTIIQFSISKEDGFYTASGVNVPIVTDGRTFEELTGNIREAVRLYFEGEDPRALGFGSPVSILTNFELQPLHGIKA